jgi:hypothetical protein
MGAETVNFGKTHDPVKFLEKYYVLENGRLIVFEDWQKKYIIRPLYFTKPTCLSCPHHKECNDKALDLAAPIHLCELDYDQDKCPRAKSWDRQYRQYRRGIVSLTKKDGKSTLAAALAVDGLIADVLSDEAPPEIFGAAGDKAQAKIIWKRAKMAIQRSPELNAACDCWRDTIVVKVHGGEYAYISSESPTKHGFNPTMKIFDEVWNQGDYDLIKALADSPVRKQPLSLFVSYAGTEEGTPWHDYYRAGCEGTLGKRTYFFWSHANLASWKTPGFLEQEKEALEPETYRQYYHNKWVKRADTYFITEPEVMRCIGWPDELKSYHDGPMDFRLRGQNDEFEYILAFDLAFKHDRTALVVMHREGQYVIIDHIKTFQGAGAKHPLRLSTVMAYVEILLSSFNVTQVIGDPHAAAQLIRWLRDDLEYEVEEFKANTPSNQTALRQNLWNLLHYAYLRFPNNHMWVTELLRMRVVQRSYGRRLDHLQRKGYYDDQVVAVGMAALKIMTTPPEEQGEPGMGELFKRGELNELEGGHVGVERLARVARRQADWHTDE